MKNRALVVFSQNGMFHRYVKQQDGEITETHAGAIVGYPEAGGVEKIDEIAARLVTWPPINCALRPPRQINKLVVAGVRGGGAA